MFRSRLGAPESARMTKIKGRAWDRKPGGLANEVQIQPAEVGRAAD